MPFVHTSSPYEVSHVFMIRKSTASCFESQITANIQDVHSQNVRRMFCSNEKLFQ